MENSKKVSEALMGLAASYRETFDEIQKLAQSQEPEEAMGMLLQAENIVMGHLRMHQKELMEKAKGELLEDMVELFRLSDRLKIVMEFQREVALGMAEVTLSEG